MKLFKFTLIVLACCLALHVSAASHPHIHVALLGDSNTFIGGDSCDKDKGWSKWFKERFEPASCKSYARSGATWTNNASTRMAPEEYTEILADNNVIYNQVLRLTDQVRKGTAPAPQLIVIMAGTNDAWFQSSRPGLFAKTPRQVFASSQLTTSKKVNQVRTLAESVRYSCEKLMEAFPNAQIVLVTPMQTAKPFNESVGRVGNIIEECAHYMALSVIRLDHQGCVYSAREKAQPRFTSDGIHTNREGARRNGYLIANQIESILEY